MTDNKDRFIEAATQPFADQAEARIAARAWLTPSIQADDPRLEEAVKRWSEVDAKAPGRTWRFAYFGVVAVVSLFVWISNSADTLDHLRSARYAISATFGTPTEARNQVFSKLTESQKQLFPDDDAENRASVTKESLWKSEPENPAYFAEFVRVYTRENGRTPPDYLETAKKLDPNNAWFTYFAAEREAKDAVSQNPDQSWKINDQKRLDRAISLLRKARDQTGFESYGAEMLSRRVKVLPQKNYPEHLDGISLLASNQASAFFVHLQHIMCGQSWTAAHAGDVEAFKEISKDGEKFLHGICDSQVVTLLNEVINFGTAKVISTRFAADAEKLGLMEESERWKGISDRLTRHREERHSRTFMINGRSADPKEFSSILMGSALEIGPKVAKFPPPLTHADLKPANLFDHAFLSRISAFATWIVMALCLTATALYRFRVASMPCGLARRTVDLLDGRDRAWIGGTGVLLPFVYVMAVNHLTPLGGHGSGVRGTGMLLPVGHFLGLWLLWFTVPVQIAGWRLAKRAGVLAFPKASWPGWVAVGAAVAFVPVIGLAAISHSFGGFWREWIEKLGIEMIETSISPALFWTAIALAAIPTLATVIRISAAVFTRPGKLIPRAASSMVLTQAYAGTLLLAALSIPVFKASGQYWFDQDKIMKTDPSMPGWSVYEYKLSVQARKELREMLGYDR